jgi:hypothetical protein
MTGGSLDLAQDSNTLLVPPEMVCKPCRKHDDEEPIREISDSRVPWLQPSLQLTEQHNDNEAGPRQCKRESVDPVEIAEYESQLVDAAAVADSRRLLLQSAEAELRHQLIDGDDEADSGDEAAQKGPGEHAVQKSKTGNTCDEDGSARHARHDPAYRGVEGSVVIVAVAKIDAHLHHTTH